MAKRTPGRYAIKTTQVFFDELPEEELSAWE